MPKVWNSATSVMMLHQTQNTQQIPLGLSNHVHSVQSVDLGNLIHGVDLMKEEIRVGAQIIAVWRGQDYRGVVISGPFDVVADKKVSEDTDSKSAAGGNTEVGSSSAVSAIQPKAVGPAVVPASEALPTIPAWLLAMYQTVQQTEGEGSVPPLPAPLPAW